MAAPGPITAGPNKAGRAILAALATSVLAGCAHDGFAPTLTHALPDRFAHSNSAKPAEIGAWWKQLRSPELDSLVAAADVDNLDIAIAVAQLESSKTQAEIAGASLWPTLEFADNNSRSKGSGTSSPGFISNPPPRNSLNRNISAAYILDVWGQNRALLDSALHSATASSYQVDTVRLTTLGTVVDSFLVYAANRERLAVAQKNLANADRVLGVIRERLSAGTASEFDSAQQGTLVENQRAAIPSLRQGYETARTAIALAIGKPVQSVNPKIRTLRQLRIPSLSAGVPTTLLVHRPDIRAAEQSLAAADANVQAARAAFLPQVQITGQAGLQSALLSTLFLPQSVTWAVAANATQTIFDGGRLRGQLKLSEAQRHQLLETYRRAVLAAVIDVENALIALRETAARETAQLRALELARRAFTLGEERLRQGTTDLTTLLQTQNALFQSEDALIQVRLARLQAVVGLALALGGGWR